MRAVRHEGEVAKVKVGQHTYNCSSKVALKRLRFPSWKSLPSSVIGHAEMQPSSPATQKPLSK